MRCDVFVGAVDGYVHRDGTVTQPQFVKGLSVAYDKMGLGLSEAETDRKSVV